MLNRRLIRIRAMQALYAYETAKAANFSLAKDMIAESFAPDLNSMEKQDKGKLQELSQLGQKVLAEKYAIQPSGDMLEAPQEVLAAVAKAKEYFEIRNRKDFDHYLMRAVVEADQIYDLYLQMLSLLLELSRRSASDARHEGILRLADNAILKALEHDKGFESQLVRRNVNWENEASTVTKLYREALKVNARYQEYSSVNEHTLEEDFAFLKYLIKNILLKHEVSFGYFEKIDLYWNDDIETIRSMVVRTLQSYSDDGKFTFFAMDDVWSESRDFLRVLFRKSIEEEDMLNKLMIPKLKNWDFERVSPIDKILIKMAIIELINFPSIPVKVTINEIIEIAKNYSSEKSSIFINGVLDAISKDLLKENKIQKSGRGMLDNK